MKNVKKIGLALCLAATTSIVPLFAQSNTYNSTAGTIRADQDKYTDLNYFDEVMFDKAFAFTNLSYSSFQLGGATKIKDMYLGAYYAGNFWGNLTGNNGSISNSTTNDNKKDPNLSSNNSMDKNYIDFNTSSNYHNFDILFGLKNMGFKLTSYLYFDNTIGKEKRNMSSSDKNETYPTEDNKHFNNPYKNYLSKDINDIYKFNLGWGGMKFGSEKTLIKPYASIGFTIYNNSLIKDYTEVEKSGYDKTTDKYATDTTTTHSSKDKRDSFTAIGFTTGSEFVWGKESNFSQVLDISNSFSVDINPKQISLTKENTIDNVLPENNKTTITEKTRSGYAYWIDDINTNYRFEYKPNEKLILGLKAGINTNLAYNNDGEITTKKTNTATFEGKQKTTITESFSNGSSPKTTVDGVLLNPTSYIDVDKTDKTLTTTMEPSFGVGLSYAVKPNFKINLGYSGTLPNIIVTDESVTKKTTTTTYSNPETKEVSNVTTNSTTTRKITTETEAWENELSTGFVWILGKNCMLDVSISLKDRWGEQIRKPSLNTIWTAGWDLGFSFKM